MATYQVVDDLFAAAQAGDLYTVKSLIENEITDDKLLSYVLERAIKYGQLDIVKYLIDHGVDVHTRDDAVFVTAVEYNQFEILKYLITYVSDASKIHEYVLGKAARNGNLEMVKCLVACGVHARKDNFAIGLASLGLHNDVINFLLRVYMKDRDYNAIIFALSVRMNNSRYIKLHLVHNINQIHTGFLRAIITPGISKHIIRNIPMPDDIQRWVATVPAVYKIVKIDYMDSNLYNNRIRYTRSLKLRRQYKIESTV